MISKQINPVHGLDKITDPDIQVFHAGTKEVDGKVFTSGGRVLSVTAYSGTMDDAYNKVYSSIGKDGIHFDRMHYRRDIGVEKDI